MSKSDLNGAVAIVTGASAGYGVGIARVLKARGAGSGSPPGAKPSWRPSRPT